MKSTFWMTAQETEDELNRRKIDNPMTDNLNEAIARYKAIRPEIDDKELAAFVDGFNRGWARGYQQGINDEKKFQKAWA